MTSICAETLDTFPSTVNTVPCHHSKNLEQFVIRYDVIVLSPII